MLGTYWKLLSSGVQEHSTGISFSKPLLKPPWDNIPESYNMTWWRYSNTLPNNMTRRLKSPTQSTRSYLALWEYVFSPPDYYPRPRPTLYDWPHIMIGLTCHLMHPPLVLLSIWIPQITLSTDLTLEVLRAREMNLCVWSHMFALLFAVGGPAALWELANRIRRCMSNVVFAPMAPSVELVCVGVVATTWASWQRTWKTGSVSWDDCCRSGWFLSRLPGWSLNWN